METPGINGSTAAAGLVHKASLRSMLARTSLSRKGATLSELSIARQASGIQHQEEEEDPFKDVDVNGHQLSHGNWKFLTVLQWSVFLILLGGLICTRVAKELKSKEIWGLELWKWFLMAMALFSGRLVSGWLIRVLVLILERSFRVRKKLLYFVYALRKGVQNCLWLGLVLLAWKLMMEQNVQSTSATGRRIVSIVTDLFECFVVGAFIWLGKLLVVKSLASSFHVDAFFDRIQDSVFHQHMLEALSGPPLRSLYASDIVPEDEENPSIKISCFGGRKAGSEASAAAAASTPPKPPGSSSSSSSAFSSAGIHNLSRNDVSAGMMSKLIDVVKHPGFQALLTTIDEEVNEIEINTDQQARVAAKMIFKNVAQPDSRFISREDLQRFIDDEEVNKLLGLLEGAKDTGKITKKALKNWVVKVYQEKRALVQSLNDTKSAVNGLHKIASVIVAVIIIIVWLLMLGIASTEILVFAGSQLLLVGFMFGNTVKQVFEAIIFLFVMHPFDVGDRCIVDGAQLVVLEMKILSTVFLKPDNEKVYYPNSVLATKPISNWYRSPEMKDFLDFAIHISTSTEQIDKLKQMIAGYVEKKSEHWRPQFTVIVKELEEINRFKLSVVMQHTINFQNFAERMSRRSEFLLEMKRFFSELGIEYHLLPQPVHILSPYPSSSAASTTSQFVNTGGYPYLSLPSSEYAGAHAGGL